jgi:hypothetical protein
MSVENAWLVEGRVLITHLSDNITIDELVVGAREGTAMIDSGTPPVYSLVDMSELVSFPVRVAELKKLTDLGTSPNLRWVLIYGINNRLVSFLATTFTQLLRTNYKVFTTQADALAFIHKLEAGIPLPQG